MTVVLLPVPTPDEPDHDTPLNDEGEPFPLAILFNANSTFAFADTYTELVEVLVNGYADIPAEDLTEQQTARILYAVRAQVRAQAAIMYDANLDLASPTELAVLNGSRDRTPEITEWTCPIPLILIQDFYAPTTEIPLPVARPRDGGAEARRLLGPPPEQNPDQTNLVWVRTEMEDDFIHDLDYIRDISLIVPRDDDDTDLFAAEFSDFINNI